MFIDTLQLPFGPLRANSTIFLLRKAILLPKCQQDILSLLKYEKALEKDVLIKRLEINVTC